MYLNISSLAMKSRESNSSLRKIIEKLADEVEKLPREFSNSQVLNAIENIKFPEFTLKAEDIIEKIVPEIAGVKT
jgi:hypothetical protein